MIVILMRLAVFTFFKLSTLHFQSMLLKTSVPNKLNDRLKNPIGNLSSEIHKKFSLLL